MARPFRPSPGWPSLEVAGSSSVLPARDVPGVLLSNERLSELMEEGAHRLRRAGVTTEIPISSPEFPLQRLGIQARPVLDQALSSRDMAVEAARRAMAAADVDPGDIRSVIVSTVTPDRPFPAIATTIHQTLGLPTNADAFDLTLGCSGSLVALGVAARCLAGEVPGSAALVIGSETLMRISDASDRATCTIFGDGAGAFLIRRSEVPRLAKVRTWTLGQHGMRITETCDPTGHGPVLRFVARDGEVGIEEDPCHQRRILMDGRRVFRDMVRTIPIAISEYLEQEGMLLGDLDHIFFHQANQRMIEAIADSDCLSIEKTRIPMNIESTGNLAGASVPVLLADTWDSGRVAAGERGLLVGFGSGYSIAISAVEFGARPRSKKMVPSVLKAEGQRVRVP